jgi:glycosyltransferase involved in cell wall biosynthesis
MPALRVALLTNFVPPYRVPVYEEIRRRCSDFRIFVSATTEPNREWVPEWRTLPVKVQRSIAMRGLWRHPLSFSEPLTLHVPYDTIPQLMRFRPDVVVSSELGMRTAQAAAYCRLNTKSKLVIWATLSDTTEQGRGHLRRWLRPKILKYANSVIINGAGGIRYLCQLGVHPSKMFRAPYTTDLAPFLALPTERLGPARHRLIYSGSLTHRKGLLLFLPVLSEWAMKNPERQIELIVAGHGPLSSELARFRAPENLKLKTIGWIAYNQVADVYRDGGILVFPTLADEWGMVVTEAMAAGVPVLGSLYSQAVEELVSAGKNGWTFHPDRPEEMFLALDRALNAPVEMVNQMAVQARATASETTPSTVAENVLSAVEYAREFAC